MSECKIRDYDFHKMVCRLHKCDLVEIERNPKDPDDYGGSYCPKQKTRITELEAEVERLEDVEESTSKVCGGAVDKIESLEAQLAECLRVLEWLRAYMRKFMDDHSEAIRFTDEALSTITPRARKILDVVEKVGKLKGHYWDCSYIRNSGRAVCDCGFSDLEEAVQALEEEE